MNENLSREAVAKEIGESILKNLDAIKSHRTDSHRDGNGGHEYKSRLDIRFYIDSGVWIDGSVSAVFWHTDKALKEAGYDPACLEWVPEFYELELPSPI